jgi:hypothetical protein
MLGIAIDRDDFRNCIGKNLKESVLKNSPPTSHRPRRWRNRLLS